MDDGMSFETFIVAASSNYVNGTESLADIYMQALKFYRPDLFDDLMQYSKDLTSDAKHNPNLWTTEDKLPDFLIFVAARW